MVFREVAAVSAFDAENAVEPIEVIQVAGENAKNFELEPAHFQNNQDETDRKENTGRKAVDRVLAECDRGVSQ